MTETEKATVFLLTVISAMPWTTHRKSVHERRLHDLQMEFDRHRDPPLKDRPWRPNPQPGPHATEPKGEPSCPKTQKSPSS